jgi:cbb3-type cytochrome oxidase subunit 3
MYDGKVEGLRRMADCHHASNQFLLVVWFFLFFAAAVVWLISF